MEFAIFDKKISFNIEQNNQNRELFKKIIGVVNDTQDSDSPLTENCFFIRVVTDTEEFKYSLKLEYNATPIRAFNARIDWGNLKGTDYSNKTSSRAPIIMKHKIKLVECVIDIPLFFTNVQSRFGHLKGIREFVSLFDSNMTLELFHCFRLDGINDSMRNVERNMVITLPNGSEIGVLNTWMKNSTFKFESDFSVSDRSMMSTKGDVSILSDNKIDFGVCMLSNAPSESDKYIENVMIETPNSIFDTIAHKESAQQKKVHLSITAKQINFLNTENQYKSAYFLSADKLGFNANFNKIDNLRDEYDFPIKHIITNNPIEIELPSKTYDGVGFVNYSTQPWFAEVVRKGIGTDKNFPIFGGAYDFSLAEVDGVKFMFLNSSIEVNRLVEEPRLSHVKETDYLVYLVKDGHVVIFDKKMIKLWVNFLTLGIKHKNTPNAFELFYSIDDNGFSVITNKLAKDRLDRSFSHTDASLGQMTDEATNLLVKYRNDPLKYHKPL